MATPLIGGCASMAWASLPVDGEDLSGGRADDPITLQLLEVKPLSCAARDLPPPHDVMICATLVEARAVCEHQLDLVQGDASLCGANVGVMGQHEGLLVKGVIVVLTPKERLITPHLTD